MKHMKKILAVMLAFAMVFSLAACGENGKENGKETGKETGGNTETAAIAKVGLGSTTSLGKSAGVDGDKPAVAQEDTTVAAVAFDADGKIVAADIDTAQNKVNINDGKVELASKEGFPSKKELKDDYGMRKASGIEKEWFEQIQAFEDFIVGKTADEVAALELDENGAPKDADLLAGCTMKIGGYQQAVANAWANAEEVKGASSIGLGLVTNLGHETKDAADGNGAKVQFETNMVATALDKDGKVAWNKTNVAQNTVEFKEDGSLVTDVTVPGTTKLELKDDYGMRQASPIGKEWFEQADAFDKWTVGKDKAAIEGMELEEGKPKDADLLAGCTMAVSDFQAAMLEAMDQAAK